MIEIIMISTKLAKISLQGPGKRYWVRIYFYIGNGESR
jgi:hypothetical protein